MPTVASFASLSAEAVSRAGAGAVRPPDPTDVIDGERPRVVVEPATAERLAATLGWATEQGLTTVVRGGGTKLDWAPLAEPFDLLLSTAALDAVVAHRDGDLTATVQAGAKLGRVNEVLRAHRQWLPLDPAWPDHATIGGIVATNDSGPRRHWHGAPRDLIIGVTIARADGQIAKAGGIVVKNVAGYDLSRLMTGSFGCLGVIVDVTFKLAPRAAASRTVTVEVGSVDALAGAVAALTRSSLTPTALELVWPDRILVRFESVEEAVAQQADAALTLLAPHGHATVVDDEAEAAVWSTHAGILAGAGTLMKVTATPAELIPTLDRIAAAALSHGIAFTASGRAGLGVAEVGLDGPYSGQVRVVAAAREGLTAGRGAAVIRRGDAEFRRRVDVWGPIGDGLGVMQAIKRRFDPTGLLNPGRGPGGL
jgi:glycolate oxidase FAD binding subunit